MVLCTSNETHAYTMSDGKCGMSESTKMFIIRTSRNQNVVMMSLELICYVYKENEKKKPGPGQEQKQHKRLQTNTIELFDRVVTVFFFF